LLASWDMYELTRAMAELLRQMTAQTQEFLAVLGAVRRRLRSKGKTPGSIGGESRL
jgi:hypothetical protein